MGAGQTKEATVPMQELGQAELALRPALLPATPEQEIFQNGLLLIKALFANPTSEAAWVFEECVQSAKSSAYCQTPLGQLLILLGRIAVANPEQFDTYTTKTIRGGYGNLPQRVLEFDLPTGERRQIQDMLRVRESLRQVLDLRLEGGLTDEALFDQVCTLYHENWVKRKLSEAYNNLVEKWMSERGVDLPYFRPPKPCFRAGQAAR